MASFTDRLDDWKPPTADDLEITLPPRREPKKESSTEEPRDLGQHGGGADGTPSDAHADSSTAPAEPAPQRDEPDEGEHTDSTQEQVAARVAQRAVVAEEPPTEEAVPEEAPAPVEAEIESEIADFPTQEPEEVGIVLARTEGSHPRPFKRVGFSAGDTTKTVLVKKIPQPLVDRLRMLVAPVLGGEFAEQISAPALISAFLSATTGVQLDMDENTAAASEVFRLNDPRVAAIEDKVDLAIKQMVDVIRIASRIDDRAAHTVGVVDALDFGVSFLVTDRVAGISTADMNEANVDVTSKKVLTARDTIRARTKERRTIEKQRDGRSMA